MSLDHLKVCPIPAGPTYDGETYRQRTAREVLAGLLANPHNGRVETACDIRAIVSLAVNVTDELIARLDGRSQDAPSGNGRASADCQIEEHHTCSLPSCSCDCHLEGR